MPVLWPDLDPTAWILKAMRQYGLVGLRSKRPRRAVPYADELLARSAGKVNYGKIKGRYS